MIFLNHCRKVAKTQAATGGDTTMAADDQIVAVWLDGQPDAKDARHDDGGGTIKQRTVLCWGSS
jgi:hypothetical protein